MIDCFQNTLIRVRAEGQLRPISVLSPANGRALEVCVGASSQRRVGIHHLGAERKCILRSLHFPPLAEQRRIVGEVERRLSVAQQAEAAVEASLARAERLRQSILKQAFSGRLVPQDPDDEPASALLARIRAEREAEARAVRPMPKATAGRRGRRKATR